jgi:hypothetical protein
MTTNPWFEENGPPEEEAEVAHHGAQVPQPGAIESSGGLPLGTHHHSAGLWIVGAHGGAGETTIAALSDAFAPGRRSTRCAAGRDPVGIGCCGSRPCGSGHRGRSTGSSA